MKKILLFFLFAIMVAPVARAGHDADEIWQPTTPGPFTTFTAPLCEEGKFTIQPLYFFNIARGVFTEDGHYKSLSSSDYKYLQLIQLYMQYGVTEHIEVDAQPAWQMINIKEGSQSAESAGFADMLLITRYCAIDETKWCPRITGLLQVKLPTGKYEKSNVARLDSDITGTGSTDFTYGLNFTKGIKPVLWHLDLLYTNIPSPVRTDGVKTHFSDIFIVNAAFEWIFYKKLNLLGELLWQSQGDMKLDGEKAPSTAQSSLIFSTGIGYSEKDWQMLVGYQRTLVGRNVDANDTIAATVIIVF